MSVILIIETRLFVRDCLHRCFSRSCPDHEIVAFGSTSEWSESIEGKMLKPALVLYAIPAEIDLMVKSEFDRLEALLPDTPIVVICDTASSDEVIRTINHGVRGIIPTSMPYHLAVEVLRFIQNGGTFLPATNLPVSRDRRSQPGGTGALTEPQMKIVEAVSHGFANKQIAYQLSMSENTVKVHLRHIMKKLNVRNRTQIAMTTRRLPDETGGLSLHRLEHRG